MQIIFLYYTHQKQLKLDHKSLRDEGMRLTHHTNVSDNQRIRLELFNKTFNKTFTLKKKTKIALFMTLNEGTEGFKTEPEKIKTDK